MRRYPLEPLLGIRRERVEKKAVEHGAAARKSDQLARLSQAAREQRERSERALGEERERQRARLRGGTARAHDLQQGERHRVGAVSQIASQKAREAEAAARAKESARAREAARVTLARARADEKATLEHARRFREAEAQARERIEEEAAADHFSVARRGARRG